MEFGGKSLQKGIYSMKVGQEMISALIERDRRKIKIIPSTYFYQNGMILEIKKF